MIDKIYRTYPERASDGPGNQSFYYSIRKDEEWNHFRIVPVPDIRVSSSGKILENELELPQGKKILVFETHSDDAGIYTADFLLKLKRAGNRIHIVNLISCHLTVGGNLSLEEKKKVRDDEDRAFAREIGASIQFLRLEFPYTKIDLNRKADGFLDLQNCKFGSPGQADFDQVFQALDAFSPDMVLLPHPFDYNQMHRDTADMVLVAAADEFFRLSDMRLLFYGGRHYFQRFGVCANIFNLLSKKEAGNKTDLLQVFRSQMGHFEEYVQRFYLQRKRVKKKELKKALCDFLVASLSRDELEKLSKEILHKQSEPPYCERFVEFEVNFETHLPG